MNLPAIPPAPNRNDPIILLFKEMGYEVSWDFKGSEIWNEFYKDGRQVMQIDIDVPLDDFLEDFACFAKGAIEGTSKSDYKVCILPEDIKLIEDDLRKHGKLT